MRTGDGASCSWRRVGSGLGVRHKQNVESHVGTEQIVLFGKHVLKTASQDTPSPFRKRRSHLAVSVFVSHLRTHAYTPRWWWWYRRCGQPRLRTPLSLSLTHAYASIFTTFPLTLPLHLAQVQPQLPSWFVVRPVICLLDGGVPVRRRRVRCLLCHPAARVSARVRARWAAQNLTRSKPPPRS